MTPITLTFTQQQLAVLNQALVELPFRVAAPLIQHINAEIQRQFDARAGDGPTGQTAPPDNFRGD
jgi:hypothetical protein